MMEHLSSLLNMDMDFKYLQTEICIKVSINLGDSMGKESMCGPMEHLLMGILLMVIGKEWGDGNLARETMMFISESIKVIRNLGKANTYGIMDALSMAIF